MKVLILSDAAGWIVDRIMNRMVENTPISEVVYTKGYYTKLSPDELVTMANNNDLLYYMNWDWGIHTPIIDQIKIPILCSVRSHRYPEYFKSLVPKFKALHVVNPYLIDEFMGLNENIVYIPDAIEQIFLNKRTVVGFAGQPSEYKGYELIKEAVRLLGDSYEFRPAVNLKPEEMFDYYKSIDIYVCASDAEGFSTCVMECLAMGKNVVSTFSGVPRNYQGRFNNLVFVDRTVEHIMAGIESFSDSTWFKDEYSYPNICAKFTEIYKKCLL